MVEEKGKQPWTLREFGGKTLWDWLQLLIVPVVLSLITVVFAWQQDIRQDQIESNRAKAERKLAEQRAQDEALQAYLDQMSGLLLEKDLRTLEVDSEVRTLARVRTLTVLERLDPRGGRQAPSGKTALMQFLVEADLVQRVKGSAPIISLRGADLRKVYLYDAADNLSGADLRNVDLSDANLSDANLSDARLHRATLSHADLSDADLQYAHLTDADLSDANLSDASGITSEELMQQAETIEGATLPGGTKHP
jgi:uncharacterized protein YjbI with pentapeptide repeats